MNEFRRFVVGSLCLVALCAPLAVAQEAPKPGPEHERLGFWVGNWTSEGEVLENPMMPAGKMTGTDKCDWFPGKFAVVCKSTGDGPMGSVKGLGIMTYSPDLKAYTYYGTDSTGMAMTSIPKGTVEGNTWTYDDESEMGGMTIKSRYIIEVTSDDSYTFKWEAQGPDGSWATVMSGKASRD